MQRFYEVRDKLPLTIEEVLAMLPRRGDKDEEYKGVAVDIRAHRALGSDGRIWNCRVEFSDIPA